MGVSPAGMPDDLLYLEQTLRTPLRAVALFQLGCSYLPDVPRDDARHRQARVEATHRNRIRLPRLQVRRGANPLSC